MIINIEVSFVDVILIEAFKPIRSVVFIPAGLGIQELAFVIIGSHVGLSDSVIFDSYWEEDKRISCRNITMLTWFFAFGGLEKRPRIRPFFYGK